MTPQRLLPHLARWLPPSGPGLAYVVHLDGPWMGPGELRVGGRDVNIRVCPSELSVREELTCPRPAGRCVVLLSPAENHAADVLARLARRRVLRIDAWEAVRHLFGVRQIDPQLFAQKWMAQALVDAAPPGGYERTAAQGLDADRAWRALLAHRYAIEADAGLSGLLSWAGGPDTARLLDRDVAERDGVIARLSAMVPGAAPVLALTANGRGREALALGLVVAVLVDGPSGEARTSARTLLSVMLGGATWVEPDARAWATASREQVQELLTRDAPAGQAALQAADRGVAALRAQELVGVSDLLAAGLRARLRELAEALAGWRSQTAALADVERAVEHVRAHRLSEHRELAAMVARIVRWLAAPAPTHTDFRAAAEAHASDESYADWARTTLRRATGEPSLDEELRSLVEQVDARRRDQDAAFAGLLASFVGHAAGGGQVLGVEEVLDRVVAPIAAQRPVLVLVLDGMSHRVAHELTDDVVGRGWIELRPTGQGSAMLVLSALPSVTAYSRTSLLSGTLVKGAAPDEVKAFAAHPGLGRVSVRGAGPLLFHKGSLKDPHGGLASELRRELAGERRVIGAVINAIDDHLARSDQLATPWTADYLPLLRLLLDEARNAGRTVILASDHGHVLDHGGTMRDGGPDHGERYRTATRPAGVGEQLVEGARVLTAGGRCVLAVDEDVRYAPRKHGYHGGGSPQEVLAPLLVLAPGLADGLEGWEETPYDPPLWWTDTAAAALIRPIPGAVSALEAVEEASGQLTLGREAVPDGPAAPRWIVELLATDALTTARTATSRGRVPSERIVAVLAALDRAGGKLLGEALARQVGIPPLRLTGTLAAMRQLLNVDGYPVLSIDEDTGDVTLDVALLAEQFGLSAASSR